MRVVLLAALLLLLPVAATAEDHRLEGFAAAINQASTASATDAATVNHIARAVERPIEALTSEQARSGLPWGDLFLAYRIAIHTGHPVEKVFAARKTGAAWKDIASDAKVDERRLEGDVLAAFPGLTPVAAPPAPRPITPPPAAVQPTPPTPEPPKAAVPAPERKRSFADRVRDLFKGEPEPKPSGEQRSKRDEKRDEDLRDFMRGTPRVGPRPPQY